MYHNCPKCYKKKFNFRVAFSSWKCYNCGFEKEEPQQLAKLANRWWVYLSNEEKVKVYQTFSKQTLPEKIGEIPK